MSKQLTVGDIISACEYVGCDVFDQLNNMIEINKENANMIYRKNVEHIEAAGGKIKIYTFDNLNKVEGINEKNQNDWVSDKDETMTIMICAMLDKIRKELDRCYWNKNQETMVSPFDNTGTEEYSNGYFTVRSYYWGDDEDKINLPNFETKYLRVYWYKHSNRGVSYQFKYGFESFGTVAVVLENCLKAIRKDFGEN